MTLDLAINIVGPYIETGIRFEAGEGAFVGQVYMHDPAEHEDGSFYNVTDWDSEKLQSYLEQAEQSMLERRTKKEKEREQKLLLAYAKAHQEFGKTFIQWLEMSGPGMGNQTEKIWWLTSIIKAQMEMVQ